MINLFEKNQQPNVWPINPKQVLPPDINMPEFMTYYPSVNDMTPEQLKYYCYWRSEWENKRPRQADLSYIFTYIYEVLIRGIENKDIIEDIVIELDSLGLCYEGKIKDYLIGWITDLYKYHGFYEEALKRYMSREDTWKGIYNLEKILNLKVALNIPMNGKELFYLGKYLGTSQNSIVNEHLQETFEYCQFILDNFKKEKGDDFLTFLQKFYGHERRFVESLFPGTPFIKTRESNIGSLILKITEPTSYSSQYRGFRFTEISFVIEFAVDSISVACDEIRQRYQKRKKERKEITRTKRAIETILWAKINESFKNPTTEESNEKCSHEYLKLQNHWEIYRKYECIKCNKIFMCECERELVEKIRPHQIKGNWLTGICPKCRGLDDTSPITSGKLMYGSTFFAEHWREIAFERDKMAFEISKNENISIFDISIDLIKSHEPEDRVRKRYGLPLIGEGWIAETQLFKTLQKIFSDYKVLHNAKTEWLGRMHLDVYIPDLKIAFEYQGKQHSVPIEYFGGEETFEKAKKRDEEKRKLCNKNGVKLYYINEGEDFSETMVKNILKDYVK